MGLIRVISFENKVLVAIAITEGVCAATVATTTDTSTTPTARNEAFALAKELALAIAPNTSTLLT